MMAEVVVMIGLPACGKSTWVKEHLAGTHLVVSKDLWPNAGHQELRQRRAIAEALDAGLDVVVDHSNPSPAERAAIIDVAHRHGARVRAVHVDTPLADCLTRNAARNSRTTRPATSIVATRRRLVPPTLAEGFDGVDTVVPAPVHV